MSDDIASLSPVQMDALREIGNVGAGNSATALSQIINRRIDMDVPRVSIVPLEEVPELVGGPDTMVVGVFLRVYGKAPSNILFLLPRDSAFYLVPTLMRCLILRIFPCCHLFQLWLWIWQGLFLALCWYSLARWVTMPWLLKLNSKLRMMVSRVISSSYQIQVRWR